PRHRRRQKHRPAAQSLWRCVALSGNPSSVTGPTNSVSLLLRVTPLISSNVSSFCYTCKYKHIAAALLVLHTAVHDSRGAHTRLESKIWKRIDKLHVCMARMDFGGAPFRRYLGGCCDVAWVCV